MQVDLLQPLNSQSLPPITHFQSIKVTSPTPPQSAPPTMDQVLNCMNISL